MSDSQQYSLNVWLIKDYGYIYIQKIEDAVPENNDLNLFSHNIFRIFKD